MKIEPDWIWCPECNGEGTFNVSDCCGAEPKSNGDCDTSDIGICSECGEYCSYGLDCEFCKGEGKVEVLVDENPELL